MHQSEHCHLDMEDEFSSGWNWIHHFEEHPYAGDYELVDHFAPKNQVHSLSLLQL